MIVMQGYVLGFKINLVIHRRLSKNAHKAKAFLSYLATFLHQDTKKSRLALNVLAPNVTKQDLRALIVFFLTGCLTCI